MHLTDKKVLTHHVTFDVLTVDIFNLTCTDKPYVIKH